MNIVCVKKVIHELYGIPDAAAPQLINTKGGSIFYCPGVGFKSQQVGQECLIGKMLGWCMDQQMGQLFF